MRTIQLTIQFDGTGYHGWQIQPCDRTVQQTVQEAVSRIVNQQVTLHGSGRTDSGVHALGQSAHFVTSSAIATPRLVQALNSILPRDIAVRNAQERPPDFHARFSAAGRVYWYLVWNSPRRSVFLDRYSWHIMRPLDVPAMRQAARHLVGVHDFSSFQGADKKQVNPVREVTSVRLKVMRTHVLLFEIAANAFLKHMVRNIMGTLADVGRATISPEQFEDILNSGDRARASATAPPQGLFLKQVRY